MEPDLDERPHFFSMTPNRAIRSYKANISSPLPAAQPLTVLSCGWEHSTPVTPGMPAGWPAAAMHALLASNRLDFSQSFHKLSPLPQICRS